MCPRHSGRADASTKGMKRDLENEVVETARHNRLINALPEKDLHSVLSDAGVTELHAALSQLEIRR